MNISEFSKPAKDRIAKVSEALDTLYGFKLIASLYKIQESKKLFFSK